MEPLMIIPKMLDRLGDEESFRVFFTRVLQALAAAVAVGAAFAFIVGWKKVFELDGEEVVGGSVYQLLFLLAAYAIVHILLVRAQTMRSAAAAAPAPVAVSAAVLKAAGEIAGIACAALGTGGGILVWFAGRGADDLFEQTAFLLPFLEAAPASFLAGATLIAKGVLYGLAALLAGYLLAALLGLVRRRPAEGV